MRPILRYFLPTSLVLSALLKLYAIFSLAEPVFMIGRTVGETIGAAVPLLALGSAAYSIKRHGFTAASNRDEGTGVVTGFIVVLVFASIMFVGMLGQHR